MKSRISLLVISFSLLGVSNYSYAALMIGGSSIVCPNENVTYVAFSTGSCSVLSPISWSVTGGIFAFPPSGSTVFVQWTSAGAKSISVTVPGAGCTFTLSGISFAIPLGSPDPPTATTPTISPATNQLCPGTTITLTTTHAAPLYPLIYFWYVNINGSGSNQISSTFSPTTTYTVPDAAPINASVTANFFVIAAYSSCPNYQTHSSGSLLTRINSKPPTGTVVQLNPRICSDAGSIQFSMTGGTGTTQYFVQILGIPGNPTFTGPNFDYSHPNLVPGSYNGQIFYVDTANPPHGPCSMPFNFTITEGSYSLSLSETHSNVTCYGGSTGSIDLTVSNGAPPFTYTWSSGQASQDLSGLTSGSYTITTKDVHQCSGSISNINITQPAALSVPAASVTSGSLPFHNGSDVSCIGVPDGQITFATPTGGSGSFQYSIDGGSTYQSGTIFSGLSIGTYPIRIRDAIDFSCTQSGSAITLSDPAPITPGSASTTQPICFGSAGTITSSGASGGTGALTWSVGGAFQSIATPFSALAGTYSITIMDANGCTATVATPTTLANPLAITLSNSIVNPTCFAANNGTITVSATNGTGMLEYSNDGGVNFQSSNFFNTGISAGSYSMVVRDAIGCLSTPSTATVGQPTIVSGSIAAPAPFPCFNTGNSASLDLTPSGGTSPYTYLWSTGSILEDISITLGTSLSTNYSVTITDSRGCTNSRNITVTQPAVLTSIIAPTNITCFSVNDGLIDLTPQGGTSPFTFLWNTGATTEDLSALPPGNYSVTTTDANGCLTSNTTSIIEPTPLTLAQGLTTNVLCNGQSNGTSNLVATGGTGIYEYSKDGVLWQSSSLITGLNAATQILRVRDQNLCMTQISVVITEPPILSVSTGSIIGALCKLANGSAQSSGAGGTGGYNFEWRDIMNQVVSTSSSLTNVSGGVYRVTITDQNGCTDFEDIAIASPDGPQIAINTFTSTQCSYTNDGAATIAVTSGMPPYSVVWNNGETGLNPIALRPGSSVNFVTVTDATACVAALAVDVPSPPILQVNTTLLQEPTCPGGLDGSVQISAQGGTGSYSYTWNTGATGSLLSPVPSGNYQVTAKDINNCIGVLPVILAGKAPIAIQANSLAPICSGGLDGSISVIATGANGSFTYAWNNGSNGPVLNNISAGAYTVTATDQFNCSTQEPITLSDPPPVQINLGPDRKICEGGTLILASPVNASAYSWSSPNGFSSTAKQVIISQSGNYTLQITNGDGCTGEDTFTLTTATDLLKADFLMATEVYEGDTVIIIDISWPLPESISWRLPSEGKVISQSSEFVEVIFENSGTYSIGLDAAIASCQDNYSQNIRVLPGNRPQQSGRIRAERLIKNVTLHPNPNLGNFMVEVDLSGVEDVEFTIVSLKGNDIVASYSSTGQDYYVWSVELPQLEQGVYFALVRVGPESKAVRFIKI